MLGGSTGLNLMAWDHASKEEYDAWATFVNNTSGSNLTKWDFANLLPYIQKSENADLTDFNNGNFSGTPPDKSVFQNDTGFSGPVQVAVPSLPLACTYQVTSRSDRLIIMSFTVTWPVRTSKRGTI
jgi:hypothetical protein